MQNYIEKNILNKKIVIFIKGKPTDTTCGYSSRAIQILNHYGVDYAYENVLQSEDLRKSVKAYSGVKTLPQIFMNGEYYGGSDDIRELHENGDLKSVFRNNNIPTNPDKTRSSLVLAVVTKDDVKRCGTETAPRQL